MKLPAIQSAIFHVHRTDFEAFIQTIFGFEYDLALGTRMPVGTIVEYRVGGIAADAHQSIKDKAAKLASGQRVNDPQILLDVLADRGAIPPGIYRLSMKEQPPTITQPARPWSLGALKITGMMV